MPWRTSPSACLHLVVALALTVLASNGRAQLVPLSDQQNSQAPGQEGPPDAQSPTSTAPLLAVHGVVTNAASGDPLPRVLVQVDGETGPGALTDGDGRFELTLSGYGSHMFQLTKPGFHDLPPNLF